MTFEETLNGCIYAEPEEVITQMSYDYEVPKVSREVYTIERLIQQELGVM